MGGGGQENKPEQSRVGGGWVGGTLTDLQLEEELGEPDASVFPK